MTMFLPLPPEPEDTSRPGAPREGTSGKLPRRIKRRAQGSVFRRIRTMEQIVDSPLEETRDRVAAFRELARLAGADKELAKLGDEARPFVVRLLVGPDHPLREPPVEAEVVEDGQPTTHIELPRTAE